MKLTTIAAIISIVISLIIIVRLVGFPEDHILIPNFFEGVTSHKFQGQNK